MCDVYSCLPQAAPRSRQCRLGAHSNKGTNLISTQICNMTLRKSHLLFKSQQRLVKMKVIPFNWCHEAQITATGPQKALGECSSHFSPSAIPTSLGLVKLRRLGMLFFRTYWEFKGELKKKKTVPEINLQWKSMSAHGRVCGINPHRKYLLLIWKDLCLKLKHWFMRDLILS